MNNRKSNIKERVIIKNNDRFCLIIIIFIYFLLFISILIKFIIIINNLPIIYKGLDKNTLCMILIDMKTPMTIFKCHFKLINLTISDCDN